MISLLLSLVGGIVVAAVIEQAKDDCGLTDKVLAIDLGLSQYDWSKAKSENCARDLGIRRALRSPRFALALFRRIVALLESELRQPRDLELELELLLMCAKSKRMAKIEMAPVLERRSA